jgi:AcrR family transcriptional regulator
MSVPGRRTYLRADDRRAQILDVAKGVFTRRGYHAASVADICAAARIGRGTLYQYFDNKRAVLLAILEDVLGRVKAVSQGRPRLEGLAGLGKAPVDMIVAFCKRRLRQVLDAVFVDQSTLRLILRDARGLDGAVDRVIAAIDELVLAALEADLTASRAAGLLRIGEPHLVAVYLLGGVEKMVLTSLTEDDPPDLEAIVETAVDIQLFGILSMEVRR